MGQKINPIGLGINRGWDSTWYAKKKRFCKYLIEDFKWEYIKKNIVNSGVSEIIIERSSKMHCIHSYISTRFCDWKKRIRYWK